MTTSIEREREKCTNSWIKKKSERNEERERERERENERGVERVMEKKRKKTIVALQG